MASIDRIHATALSINDRFTIMQKVGGGVSRRSQQVRMVPPSTSTSLHNRTLLHQLEQQHKLRTAMKIKRKRLSARPTTAVGTRRRAQNRLPVAATTANVLGATNVRRRLKRLNSVSKRLATLKADLLQKANRRPLRRANSASNVSITERLGVRGRPRLRRQQPTVRASSRARSASRSRNNNLPRTNSSQNLTQRSRSRGRSASRQRQASPQPRRRSRSRSRANGNANANPQPVQNRRRLIRRRSRSNLRKVTSVNDRLGVRRGTGNGTNATQQTASGKKIRIRRGRVAKRRASTVRNQIVNGGTQRQAAGRSRSRTRQNANTNQNVSRKRGNGKRQQRQQPQPRQQPGQNRGKQQTRGRSRSRNVRGGRPVKREPPKSKEDLDKELEQYMVNTKTSLDRELGIYRN